MKVSVLPGKYVIAVSGGVDSMVLLDLLHRQPGLELTVAHFDHGMREDSALDRELVRLTAHQYGLHFLYGAVALGANASEATARDARYKFLREVLETTGAKAIITAHHQDDVLETAVLNMLRGTRRLGLSSLRSHHDILRPLLHMSKRQIVAYARARRLAWRDDSTNQNDQYLRNYIRHRLLPRLNEQEQSQLLSYIQRAHYINEELDHALVNALHVQPARDQLQRQWFIMLPYVVSAEIMAAWLRQHDIRSFDQKLIHQLVVAAKTLAPGKRRDISATFVLRITKDMLCLTRQPLRKNKGSHV